MSCCLAILSRRLIPGSPRFKRFSNLVPGPMYWYPGQWNSIPVFPNHFWTSSPKPHCFLLLIRVLVFLSVTVRVIVQFFSQISLWIPTFPTSGGLKFFCTASFSWFGLFSFRQRFEGSFLCSFENWFEGTFWLAGWFWRFGFRCGSTYGCGSTARKPSFTVNFTKWWIPGKSYINRLFPDIGKRSVNSAFSLRERQENMRLIHCFHAFEKLRWTHCFPLRFLSFSWAD